ncbi:MAG TPA: DUF1385 domain-containing protein [Oscillospiraceae bacterium]|nr:DUF1385 domain-containing protein [Oscillospiraceae bacterium]
MSSKKNSDIKHKTSVGGQALLEGIMMQGPKGAYMSVRLPDGTIETEKQDFKRLKDRFRIAGLPVIRGVITFIESMVFGFKCMTLSAEKAGIDTEQSTEDMSKLDKWITEHMGKKMMTVLTLIASVIGFSLAFLMFFYLPTLLVDLADKHLFSGAIKNFQPLIEGIIRMIIFVVYIFAVSKVPDIKRVFMYHGAEHKSITCYEKGLELTVDNVRGQCRFHPRCGTSFIFVMLIISIVISSALTLIFKGINDNRLIWVSIKMLIMPLVMGLGYEFIKYSGKHDNFVTKVLSAPGLLMQRITTVEPDDDIIEVGIDAIKAVITENPEDDAI